MVVWGWFGFVCVSLHSINTLHTASCLKHTADPCDVTSRPAFGDLSWQQAALSLLASLHYDVSQVIVVCLCPSVIFVAYRERNC